MAVAVKPLFPTTRGKPSRSSRAGQGPALIVKAAQTRPSTLMSRRKLPAGMKSSLLGKSPSLLSLLFFLFIQLIETISDRTWNNREREFFQNCAVVTITGGGAGISSLPNVLVSNIGNGCLSPLTTAELKYPDPGTVVELGDGEYPLVLPTGNC